MTLTINLQARHLTIALLAITAAVFTVWWAAPASSQTAEPNPVDRYAVVARSDNPVDALAASAVAGQLGAPVYLTPTRALDEHASQGLVDTAPDVVVLAGGLAALSQQVEDQIVALLPDASVRRIAGGGRTETARLLNQLPGQLGIVRPVLAGATVAGDVGIDGTLTVSGTDVAATLATVLDRLEAVETRTGALESDLATANGRIATLESEVDELQATLEGVTRTTTALRDGSRDTLVFSGMNLQIVNGTGTTDGTPNGEGNLILGYSALRPKITVPADRAGSHYLITGDEHHWTSYGGIVAGERNAAIGDYASVTGGLNNTASSIGASVTGGQSNTASGAFASVSTGFDNIASGNFASVSGGGGNTASGSGSSVSGGQSSSASGIGASVSGGSGNIASGNSSSVAGGRDGTVSDTHDSRVGNTAFPDS